MKLQYLEETRRDIAWWRIYYGKTFPQGASNAAKQLKIAEKALQSNPSIGAKIEGREYRKLSIPRTPFAFIYWVRNNTIEIARVYDMRQQGSEGFQEDKL